MPGFDAIIGQEDPIGLLKVLLRKGQIPHALLFTGLDGIGKKTTALAFAMACQCELRSGSGMIPQDAETTDASSRERAVPCGRCRQCRRIGSGLHPDVLQISPTGLHIRIEQIRSLCDTLAMKPYEAGPRIVVISDAQKMTAEAGNALLKVLEEPPDRTIFILTTQQTSDLLPTIVSRCQQIRFNPLSRKNLEQLLMEKHGQTPPNASILAGMAGGSYARAQKMAKGNWLNWRRWLISAIGLDESGRSSSRPLGEILAYSEKLSQKKERIDESLELLKTWFRDLIIYRFAQDQIIHKDAVETISALSKTTTIRILLDKIQAIQTAQNSIQANSNVRLTLDMMVLRLCGLAGGDGSS